MNIKDYLSPALINFNLELKDEDFERFNIYYKLLIEWNEKMNLTAITAPNEVAVKHFADSLSIFNYENIPIGASVIDVGTGAGFPGVAIKIVRPDIKLTLLDSLQKRLNFLRELLNQLGLDAELIHSRAEEGGQRLDLRENFDFAVSRAVARLNTLSEYCLPYVRLGGRFIAFKGIDYREEADEAKEAIGILGGKIIKINTFELPFESGGRALISIEKVRPTPDKYPRHGSKIKSKPL